MLAGAEHGISKANIVLGATKDFDLALRIKRERTQAGAGRGYMVRGSIETIYFEPDKACKMPIWKAEKVGCRIYWPEGGPILAQSIPEGDLLIVSRLPIRDRRAVLPDVPDPNRPARNPFLVDRHGRSHLPEGQKERQAPKYSQLLEEIASNTFKNFVVIHPVAQIVMLTIGGSARWGSVGSPRMPISSLTSFDGTKMALLVDPYTGECIFKGGRYDIGDQLDLDATAIETMQQKSTREEISSFLRAGQ